MEVETNQLVAHPSISRCAGGCRWVDQYSDYPGSDISSGKGPWAQLDHKSPVDRIVDGLDWLQLETQEGNASSLGELLGRLRLRTGHGLGALSARGDRNLNSPQDTGSAVGCGAAMMAA